MWRHRNEQIHRWYGSVIIWSTIGRHCILMYASEIKTKYTCKIKTSLNVNIGLDYDLGILYFLSSLKAYDIVAGPPDTFQRIKLYILSRTQVLISSKMALLGVVRAIHKSSNSFWLSLKMLYHTHCTSPTICGMMTTCYGHTCYITVIFRAIHQSPLPLVLYAYAISQRNTHLLQQKIIIILLC